MVAIQEISARVGRVTGHGISGNVCRHYSPWLLNVVVALLFIANTVNIAADLAAMADATKLLIGGSGHRLRAVLWRGLGDGADLPRLQALRVGAEMADAQPVRLCRSARLCACVVGRGADRRAGAAPDLERGLFHHHRRDPRHHDLALSVLLAGLAGSRRPARRRDQAAADRQALRRAKGIPSHPRRHHRRHGVLQPDRAGDHLHRRRHAACGREDRHPDLGAGGGSAAADRRRSSPK